MTATMHAYVAPASAHRYPPVLTKKALREVLSDPAVVAIAEFRDTVTGQTFTLGEAVRYMRTDVLVQVRIGRGGTGSATIAYDGTTVEVR